MHLDDTSITPDYSSDNFANLPRAIDYLLTGEGDPPRVRALTDIKPDQVDTVILFLIDAFGWSYVQEAAEHPFLRRFFDNGTAGFLNSQFPSTTAAHITCIHTGLPVSQHGVYEWQYYEPQYDAIIAPLMHSYAGLLTRDLLPTHVNPHDLYPKQTLYHDLEHRGVTSYVFQHREYTPSTYSDIMFQGAHTLPYVTLPEALVNMAQVLQTSRGKPTYIFLYYDKIDTISHRYGPGSPQLEAEIDALLTTLERQWWQQLAAKAERTLFLLVADHGQVKVDPARTIYLNRDPLLSGVERYLKRNQAGELLVPAGSCRDLFLYIDNDHLDEAESFLSERLSGRARVLRTSYLLEQGWFGPAPVLTALRCRLGDLVILPNRDESIWWYEQGKFEMRYHGHHGGLTPDEVQIPLLHACL